MTPDEDGWIKHNGGNNPVTPECWVQLQNETQAPMRADDATWSVISRYRIFAPVTPGPSPFVAETAAKIMAQLMSDGSTRLSDNDMARCAVAAALALEAALKGVKG